MRWKRRAAYQARILGQRWRNSGIGGSHQAADVTMHAAARVSGRDSGEYQYCGCHEEFLHLTLLRKVALHENRLPDRTFRMGGFDRTNQCEDVALRSQLYLFTQTINADGCGEPAASGHIALPSPNVTTDP
jgi:hypothetical protein